MSSLQRLCERSLAEHDVEPRTCLQIMEYADACGAEVLKQFCLAVGLPNVSLTACARTLVRMQRAPVPPELDLLCRMAMVLSVWYLLCLIVTGRHSCDRVRCSGMF